jgi:hypothetical protein
MCGGWPALHETEPDAVEWRRRYVPLTRRLLDQVHAAVSPQAVKVIVLRTPDLEGERLNLLLQVVDEVFQNPNNVVVLGPTSGVSSSIAGVQLELNAGNFAKCAQITFGSMDEALGPTLPAHSGQVPVFIEQLRDLEVDLELLHSRVL